MLLHLLTGPTAASRAKTGSACQRRGKMRHLGAKPDTCGAPVQAGTRGDAGDGRGETHFWQALVILSRSTGPPKDAAEARKNASSVIQSPVCAFSPPPPPGKWDFQ